MAHNKGSRGLTKIRLGSHDERRRTRWVRAATQSSGEGRMVEQCEVVVGGTHGEAARKAAVGRRRAVGKAEREIEIWRERVRVKKLE